MKDQLKIEFSDFLPCDPDGLDIFKEWAESRGFIVDKNDPRPDILIHSCWGIEHLHIPARLKVSYTGENLFPNLNIDDYAVSHMRDSVGGRNFYYPLAVRYLPHNCIQDEPLSSELARRKFAIFIASQDCIGHGARLRRDFAEYVMQHYKPVDCPGRVLHNIDIPELQSRQGDWITGKRRVMRSYKFNICFENSNSDGYITEKLVDAFICNTVPIYWGSEGNVTPFPKEAMICANDYPDFASLLERVREVDANDELYLNMLAANPLRNTKFLKMPDVCDEALYAFLDSIAERAMQKSERMNAPSKGIYQNDTVCRVIETAKETPRKRIPYVVKLLINLIPIAAWRRRMRKKYLR